MDCNHTSLRPAHDVTCAYRRDKATWFGREVKNAYEEGVKFPVQPSARLLVKTVKGNWC